MSMTLSFVKHLNKVGRELDFLIDSARYHFHRGQKARALTLYRQVASSGCDNPEIIGRVAAGLRELGKMDEACELVRLAMFQHPRDRRFQQLWQAQRFAQSWAKQQGATASSGREMPILKFRGA